MTKRSIHRFGGAICAMLMTTVAIPAHATKYVVVGAEPDPAPNRSVYIMSGEKAWVFERFVDGFDKVNTDRVPNLAATLDANTIRTVIVYQVFENAGGTNFISYNLDFRCQEGLVSIARAASNDRAGKEEVRTSTEWMRVPDNWMGKAEMIACDWKSWQSARQVWEGSVAASPKRKKKNQDAASSFASLGIEYLGEANMFNVTDAVDLVWNTRWTDAVQPAYYEGTAEEKAEAAAKLAETQGKIKGLLTEQKKWADISFAVSAKAERIGGKYGAEMGSIGGMTEEQVIARWGAPASYIERSGIRTLTYYFSDTQYGVDYVPVDVISQNGNIVGQSTRNVLSTNKRECSRTIHLKEGGAATKAYRVFDFDIGCS
jgi:hypothetical protein